jgi:MoaA/NifB/PqqE/SkfB family radical SAM enzyme
MITKYAENLKKAPGWIYKTAAQLYIDKEWPRHLFIETTAACNLSCSYCPRERINKHMDYGLFKSIIDEGSHYGPRSFSLHLFGEPLLYPKVWEAIEYIKKKNKRNTVLLTSNGTLFERFIDNLLSSGIDKLIWSWRPEPKFSDRTVERLRKWGKMTVRLIEEAVPKEEMRRWESWPRVEKRSLHNYGGNVDIAKFGAKSTDGQRYPCYHLWLAPAVSWSGNFLMCCSDPHQREIFGDINRESIHDSWKRLDAVRSSHMRGEYSGICKNCDVWKSYPDLFFKWQKS